MTAEQEGDTMLPIIGYTAVWSRDRNVLVQIFRDLETDSIELVTLDKRADSASSWESVTQVGKD